MVTAANVRLLDQGSKRYRVRKEELESSGDGTVPFWSSTLQGVQNLAVGGEHSVIYQDRKLRLALARVLGKEGVLAAEVGKIDLAIRERVAEPRGRLHVVMTVGSGATTIDGTVQIERTVPDPATGIFGGLSPGRVAVENSVSRPGGRHTGLHPSSAREPGILPGSLLSGRPAVACRGPTNSRGCSRISARSLSLSRAGRPPWVCRWCRGSGSGGCRDSWCHGKPTRVLWPG